MEDFDVDKIAEVHRQIDEVLLHDWDPIGVSTLPQCATEYRSYCRGVYDVAVQTRSATAIVDHLTKIEHERMGISSGRAKRLLPVAQKILTLVVDVGPLP